MEIVEMLESVQMADAKTTGYKFHCASVPNKCQECGEKYLNFITQDIEKAYQHSKRNRVAMWIDKG